MAPSVTRASSFFFFIDTATTEIYTLSLHDALPIWARQALQAPHGRNPPLLSRTGRRHDQVSSTRSEEHTSELQSRENLVCRLLLEKKKRTRRPLPLSDRGRRAGAPTRRPRRSRCPA